jgi:hypothetical protein
MKRTTLGLALVLLVALVVAPAAVVPFGSTALAAPQSTPAEALEQLCTALSQANPTLAAQVTTPELYARLKPELEAATPGSLGTFCFAPNGYSLPRGNYATACVLRHQRDGVEDLVFVTLRMNGNGTWVVCGGPTTGTPASPLR